MAIDMPDRVVQIATRLNFLNLSETIYSVGTAKVLNTLVNYNGFVSTIRVSCYLDSIPEVHAPVILPTDTLVQKEQKNQMFRSQPKIGLLFSLKNANGDAFEVGMIDLYNVKPIFLTAANEFFTDLDVYGMQYGWSIFAEIVDRGFGVLLKFDPDKPTQTDWVSITGFVTEKSSFLQDADTLVYNYIL
jgi:hypothetical protein